MIYRSLREEELFIRIRWFIKLRWVFLVGLIFTVLITRYILNIELPLSKILSVGAVVFIYNSALYLFHRFYRFFSIESLKIIRWEANIQVGMDLISLTLLIHFSGGVENPFIAFYLFHAIIGSILLSRAEVWIHGLISLSLFISIVSLEYFGVIHHYHLKGFLNEGVYRNLFYVSAVCLALSVALFTTIYMSSSIVKRIRIREDELLLTRNILQKKSEDLKIVNIEKQKQLIQSEKLSSLGQLVSGCAHEINNPVQFILGNMRIFDEAFADILPILDEYVEKHQDLTIARLKYSFFQEHIKVLLEDMATGAKRIRDIVMDLKAFARGDEGLMNEEVDINKVVRICRRLVHNRIKRLEVEEDLEENLHRVFGSENKLEQVVMACLINAAEALNNRSDGKIKITTRTEDNGGCISFSIADNGPGMTEEIKKQIFDPFFTTKQRSGGTGLGLSISYGIIKEHGGEITVKTKHGEGTTFVFHLPTHREDIERHVVDSMQSRLEATFDCIAGNSITYNFDDRERVQCCRLYSDIPLGSPMAVSLLIRGEGSLHQLRMECRDRLNDLYTISFPENPLLDLGWHVVSARIPKNAQFPLTLKSICVLRNEEDRFHTSGTIDLDDFSTYYPS